MTESRPIDEDHGPVRLRLLSWDHPRCTGPVRAAVTTWTRLHPEIAVQVRARPLSAFNDQPVSEVAQDNDLLFIDHPMVGRCVRDGVLASLDELVPTTQLNALATDTIGHSHQSYRWQGRQWATAVDAACQVSAWRPDILQDGPPATWDDVLALAAKPGQVAIPLYPSDAYLSLLSISASRHPHSDRPAQDVDEGDVAALQALVALVNPSCFEQNPPTLLEQMTSSEPTAPAYCPLTFGYAAYQSRAQQTRRLRFGDPPRHDGPARSMLGGAGLAVSAASPHRREAARLAAWMAGSQAQRDHVVANGGQPGSRSAWYDPDANDLTDGFLHDTAPAMERSVVRPRDADWPEYQRQAGELLVELLRARADASRIVMALRTLADRLRKDQTP